MTQARLTAVRQKLAEWQVDGLIIGSPANRYWLSGFSGSAGYLLVTADKAIVATDFRYWTQVKAEAPAFELMEWHRRDEDWLALARQGGVRRLGLEAQHITLLDAARFKKATDIDWVELPETLESLREVKTAVELEKIRAAARITDQIMSQVNEIAQPGMTEKQLAWELEKSMREIGADSMAFTVIVASGPHSALPHHHPDGRSLQVGDAIVVDMGAQLNDYKSDLTRTFHLGNHPSEAFWQIYNLVLEAQTAVLRHSRPGMSGKEIDALARDVITAANHGEHFGHGLGHGVGLDIHEGPSLSTRNEKPIMPGMIMTVEPGVYVPDWGGVRIEDLLLMTENGLQSLSQCPKNPIIPV